MSSNMNRRSFVKAGVAAVAGAVVTRTAYAEAAPASKTISIAGGMPVRTLGATGHSLPVFGHGGSAMVKMWGKDLGVEVSPFAERVAMVRHGYEKGIRYFDTARIYQDSEKVMGEALADVRDDAYLCTKVTVGEPGQVRPSVEQSLAALKTSYFDCLQFHGPVYERVGYDAAMKIVEEIVALHDEGVCRFVGLTGHSGFDTMLPMIRTGAFDQLMIAYGYFARAYDSTISSAGLAGRDLCVAEAHKRNMGLIAMKVLGASFMGHRVGDVAPELTAQQRTQLIGAAIRWAYQDERFAIYNLGISIPQDIDHDVRVFQGDLAFTAEDRALLASFGAQAYGSEIVQGMKIT